MAAAQDDAPTASELQNAMGRVAVSSANRKSAERTLSACKQPQTSENFKFVLAVKHLSAIREKSGKKAYRFSPAIFESWKGMITSSVERTKEGVCVPKTNLKNLPPEYLEYTVDLSALPENPINFDPETEVILDPRANPRKCGPGVDRMLYRLASTVVGTLAKGSSGSLGSLTGSDTNAQIQDEPPASAASAKSKKRLLKPRVSDQENLEEELETTATNVKNCLLE